MRAAKHPCFNVSFPPDRCPCQRTGRLESSRANLKTHKLARGCLPTCLPSSQTVHSRRRSSVAPIIFAKPRPTDKVLRAQKSLRQFADCSHVSVSRSAARFASSPLRSANEITLELQGLFCHLRQVSSGNRLGAESASVCLLDPTHARTFRQARSRRDHRRSIKMPRPFRNGATCRAVPSKKLQVGLRHSFAAFSMTASYRTTLADSSGQRRSLIPLSTLPKLFPHSPPSSPVCAHDFVINFLNCAPPYLTCQDHLESTIALLHIAQLR